MLVMRIDLYRQINTLQIGTQILTRHAPRAQARPHTRLRTRCARALPVCPCIPRQSDLKVNDIPVLAWNLPLPLQIGSLRQVSQEPSHSRTHAERPLEAPVSGLSSLA